MLVPNTMTEEGYERALDRAVVELMEEGLTELQARLCALQEACFEEAPESGVLGARVGQPMPISAADLELLLNEEGSSLVVANLALVQLLDSPGAALRATPRRPGAPA